MDQGDILKTLLHELKDGVIVCDADAKITLFNGAAVELFRQNQALAKGKSLYKLCFKPPIEHAINLLQYQHDLKDQPGPLHYIQFMNTTVGSKQYFRCRLSFLPPLAERKKSFIMVLEDISSWYTPDSPLFLKIEEFRAPMTNLRAAVENLTEYPEMSPVMRSAFENVLVQESLNLTEVFDSLARSCKMLMQAQNQLTELNTDVLFGYVAHHLRKKKISLVSCPDLQTNVKIDIYGLLLVLDSLVSRIRKSKKRAEHACKLHIGKKFIYMDFIWAGEGMTTGSVKTLLGEKMKHSVGAMTTASILHSMDGDIWTQLDEDSRSMLRLALPIANANR